MDGGQISSFEGVVFYPLFIWVRKKMEQLLNAKDVARLLKVSLPLVYKLADRGQLPCVRWECPGEGERKKTMVRFELDAVRGFIEKHRQNG